MEIRLASRKGGIELSVRDDGAGLPPEAANSRGMGMHIMNYRAKMIGAAIQVAALEEGGTCVSCSIPMPRS